LNKNDIEPKIISRDLINKIFYKFPDEYITISSSIANDIEKLSNYTPVRVFENKVDHSRIIEIPSVEAKTHLDLEGVTVIMVIGRVYFKQKGQNKFFESIHELLGENLKLIFVGDGPDLFELKNIVRVLGAQKNVLFFEWVENPSIFYSAADIVAIPSLYEGVPMVLLESLYFKKRVITSNFPVFGNYIDEQFIFDLNKPDSIRGVTQRAVSGLI